MMMRLVMSAAVCCVLLAACSITKFADSIPSESAGSTAAHGPLQQTLYPISSAFSLLHYLHWQQQKQ